MKRRAWDNVAGRLGREGPSTAPAIALRIALAKVRRDGERWFDKAVLEAQPRGR